MPSEKECFGVLDIVFPVGERGLRESSPECFECPERVECLRAALDTREGLAFKSEIIDRTAANGILGRIRRWSEKKELHRRMKEKGKGETK